MVSNAVISGTDTNTDGVILSFVVPAPKGCNLSCPFCIIKQRKEKARNAYLSPSDYYEFLFDAHRSTKVGAICIQGYEPLLGESFEYTTKILEAGQHLGIPTGMVTNGLRLGRYIEELRKLEPYRIAVSLDAAMPEQHDRLRGKIGAWQTTVDGLRRAAEGLSSKTELVVTSVLLPKRRHLLQEMPILLKEIGIKRWTINLLQKVGRDQASVLVGNRNKIFEDLVVLKAAAEACEIKFIVDDEFDGLKSEELTNNILGSHMLRINRLPKPSDLLRLLPTGQCSAGRDILKQVSDTAPVWIPKETNAGSFIHQMQAC